MKKNYSYIGIAFIILVFGIYVVPKVIDKFQKTSDLATFEEVPRFEFMNQHGNKITNKDYEGKVFVVEFFFSTCPSICPIMKREMLTLQNKFFANQNFGIASISITPEIDTPEVLKEYASNNGITHNNWHLLTGKPQDDVINLATKGFKLYAGVGEDSHGGFEHSGLFALIDKNGKIRSRKDAYGNPIVYYRAIEESGFPNQIQELKEDIKILLNE